MGALLLLSELMLISFRSGVCLLCTVVVRDARTLYWWAVWRKGCRYKMSYSCTIVCNAKASRNAMHESL